MRADPYIKTLNDLKTDPDVVPFTNEGVFNHKDFAAQKDRQTVAKRLAALYKVMAEMKSISVIKSKRVNPLVIETDLMKAPRLKDTTSTDFI